MYGDELKKITLSGKVAKATQGGSSKSAHQGFVLLADSKQIKLRREGGNPFYDNFFEKYENKEVVAEGFDMEQYFLVTNIQPG